MGVQLDVKPHLPYVQRGFFLTKLARDLLLIMIKKQTFLTAVIYFFNFQNLFAALLQVTLSQVQRVFFLTIIARDLRTNYLLPIARKQKLI